MVHSELVISVLIIMTGFVCSGVLGSFYQWVRAKPAGFSVSYDTIISSLVGVVMCVFAGPFIIMRNTIRARQIEGQAIGWVVAASGIATLWSFCTGLLILHFFFAIQGSI